MVIYDNAEELWGAGIGCNGVISLWLEPLSPRLLHFWKDALTQRRPARSALMYRCSESTFTQGQRWYDDEIPVAWQLGHYHGPGWSVFVEQLQPPPQLVVCGAGPDAVPLVAGAVRLGWDVQLVDHRAGFLDPQRFPGAELRALPKIATGSSLVIMSHNLERDRGYLDLALASPAAYIGMLGPHERTRRLLAGRQDPRIHGPVGLDLGSQTPEEIALSILAEIMAVQSGRQGGFLRDRRVFSSDRS
ncbi:XdhC family protein [bacterium]|nr:XdhC family protein [bacterium]